MANPAPTKSSPLLIAAAWAIVVIPTAWGFPLHAAECPQNLHYARSDSQPGGAFKALARIATRGC